MLLWQNAFQSIRLKELHNKYDAVEVLIFKIMYMVHNPNYNNFYQWSYFITSLSYYCIYRPTQFHSIILKSISTDVYLIPIRMLKSVKVQLVIKLNL